MSAVPAAGRRLVFGAGRNAPRHPVLAVGRKIAEGHVDQQPFLQHAVDRGGDLFLKERQAGIAQMLGLGPLDKRDNRVASSFLILGPKLRQSNLPLLWQNAEQMELDVELTRIGAKLMRDPKTAQLPFDEILRIHMLSLLKQSQ